MRLDFQLFLLMIGMLLLLASRCNQTAEQPYIIVSHSPDRSYEIEIKERVNVDKGGFFPKHEMWLNVRKKGEYFVSNSLFYQRDRRFMEMYASHNWMTNNVLRFGTPLLVEQESCDEIVVNNWSDRAIAYVTVRTSNPEILFLLDLQSSENAKLRAQPNRDVKVNSNWLSAEAHFTDKNHNTLYAEATFRKAYQSNKTEKFCVNIKGDKIIIDSLETDGEVDGKPVFPKNSNCGR